MDYPTQVLGHRVAVIAMVPYEADYVPLEEAKVFVLFPDVVSRAQRTHVVPRIGRIRIQRPTEPGRLTGDCTRWWDVRAVLEKARLSPGVVSPRLLCALTVLRQALERNHVSPLGQDLPIYLDGAKAAHREMDWETLEWDVMRGLNGQIPFDYQISQRMRNRMVDELPFLDIEHFRSVVPDGGVMMSLVRQLLEQHAETVRGMWLVPARWIREVRPDDVIVVGANIPLVIDFVDPMRARVSLGALDVPLRRTGQRAHRGRRRRHQSRMATLTT